MQRNWKLRRKTKPSTTKKEELLWKCWWSLYLFLMRCFQQVPGSPRSPPFYLRMASPAEIPGSPVEVLIHVNNNLLLKTLKQVARVEALITSLLIISQSRWNIVLWSVVHNGWTYDCQCVSCISPFCVRTTHNIKWTKKGKTFRYFGHFFEKEYIFLKVL